MLTTDFKKTPAYKFGFIDRDGNRIKKIPHPEVKNQFIENNPKTKEEKNSLTPLHRLVFNLKKLLGKLPGGKTAFASYAVALALLKEHAELDSEQSDQLFEDFYKLIKREGLLTPEQLSEAQNVGKIPLQDVYRLRTQIKQNFDENEEIKIYPAKSIVSNISEKSIGYGILIYEGRIGEDRVLFTAEDVY
tara:strand:+ start:3426 stop:3995 length:570 start_codon:yes stop_codon:yes gene_type:complete